MAKVNSILSLETVGTNLLFNNEGELKRYHNVLATVKNGNKRGKFLIQSLAPHNEISFTKFSKYVTNLYEMVLLLGTDENNAREYAEEYLNDVDNFVRIFHQAVEVSKVLETVFGDKLGYFIFNFCNPSLKRYRYRFYTIEEKKETLIMLMKERTQN